MLLLLVYRHTTPLGELQCLATIFTDFILDLILYYRIEIDSMRQTKVTIEFKIDALTKCINVLNENTFTNEKLVQFDDDITNMLIDIRNSIFNEKKQTVLF